LVLLTLETVDDVVDSVIADVLEVVNLGDALNLELLHAIVVGEDSLFELLLEVGELDQNLLVVVLVELSQGRVLATDNSGGSLAAVDQTDLAEVVTRSQILELLAVLLLVSDCDSASALCDEIHGVCVIELLHNDVLWLFELCFKLRDHDADDLVHLG